MGPVIAEIFWSCWLVKLLKHLIRAKSGVIFTCVAVDNVPKWEAGKTLYFVEKNKKSVKVFDSDFDILYVVHSYLWRFYANNPWILEDVSLYLYSLCK